MSAASSTLLLAQVLLGVATPAPPSLPDCAVSPARVELLAQPTGGPTEICISPEQPTIFRFDTPLMPDSVGLRGRERFDDVGLGTYTITVIPPADLQPGERFELRVRFADGAAPTSATFWLVGHPALGTRQVNVFREPRTVEDYQREAHEERQKTQRLLQDLERVQAESGPGGLTGLIASGLLGMDEGSRGVEVQVLTRDITLPRANALVVGMTLSLRTNTSLQEGDEKRARVAVAMRVKNPGPQPWVLQGAALVAPGKEPLQMRAWHSGPLLPEARESGLLVVEGELPERDVRGTFTLKVWDESGTRLVSVGNVTFP